MAGLKVFISSTCADLGSHREQIRSLLVRMGYEPIMSEFSDVLYDHRQHTHASCLRDVTNADIVILLIGSRFGGSIVPEALNDLDLSKLNEISKKGYEALQEKKISITQAEVIQSIQNGIPLFTFVDQNVRSDHHLYQKNKGKNHADLIEYPSISSKDTAKYIFEFINFINSRVSNNSIIPYSNFSDIESHLIKQWSLTFQRLLQESREKLQDAQKRDALLEEMRNLKAAVIQAIPLGTAREVARNVIKFRPIADFLSAIRKLNNDLAVAEFQGTFEELLAQFDIIGMRSSNPNRPSGGPTTLILASDDFIKLRITRRRFRDFAEQWEEFSKLDGDTKIAVIEAVEESGTSQSTLIISSSHPLFKSDDESEELPELIPSNKEQPTIFWTPERTEKLVYLWNEGHTASEISAAFDNTVSRNAIIGKAYRLGLRARGSDTEIEFEL